MRDWYDGKCANLRLVRSPLTFGHSQLLINHQDTPPRTLFADAGELIGAAIEAMQQCFTPEKRLKEFSVLEDVTETTGKLVKVLVLRASASENVSGTLKIHLVPYFDSHEKACRDRFQGLHSVLPVATGGLLGWLGDREDRADKWEVDFLDKEAHEKWAADTLRLGDLAKELKKRFIPPKARKR